MTSFTISFSPLGRGSGSALPFSVLLLAGLCTAFAVFVSAMSIFLHLKNYRKPLLQRMVIRIMLMVPIYGISSLISLFSLEAAFVIDAIRDIYEAFVIYCFFNLLLGYLGGERSLLILLHGREPKQSVFPASLFKREMDVSDPYMFLFLKRGILQYVQVKPALAIATLILKALGKYNDGDLNAKSGYLYISIVYNVSICLSLYCLAMFWICVNEDLMPFRPVPKFLCVKGILFFSFWQSIGISILVAAGAITKLGPYTDSEHISLGLTDTLICFEMPIFAVAHLYAFSHTDYIDRHLMYAARMPIYYAIRDAFGYKDVVEDTMATLRGEGMDYREFEPAEGFIHQGSGRDRRIKAGLRYAQGGQKKYWLPMPADVTETRGYRTDAVHDIASRVGATDEDEDDYAPLLAAQAADIVHDAPDMRSAAVEKAVSERRGFELPFSGPDPEDEELFGQSRNYVFGDYHYPCIDASSELARQAMWAEEERVLRDELGAFFSPIRGAQGRLVIDRAERGYGAVGTGVPAGDGKGKTRGAKDAPFYEEDRRLIDRDHDRIPDFNHDEGVRLGWTKYDKPGKSRTPSARASPQLRNTALAAMSGSRRDSSGSASGSGSSRNSPPAPTIVPPQRSASRSPRAPDAVDLVVENSHAAEAETSKERRRGEPAVRGAAWRKAFTRGYFLPDTRPGELTPRKAAAATGASPAKAAAVGVHGEEADEESSGGGGTTPVEGEGWVEEVGLQVGGVSAGAPAETVIEEAGMDVARAATPPPHARLESPRFDYPLHDENPWA